MYQITLNSLEQSTTNIIIKHIKIAFAGMLWRGGGGGGGLCMFLALPQVGARTGNKVPCCLSTIMDR